ANDGNVYKALFLPKTDGDYYFSLDVQPSVQRPQAEKDAIKKINAVFNASAWTAQRLLKEEL
ncbi:MAG: hypothetical protein II814_12195, partial [Treponema sp.]|nr:hypothetical protein [Treponema sp.]